MGSMRIAIIATGSTGDVLPYVALAKGLAASGNEIRFVSHDNYETLVEDHCLEFSPIEGDVQDIAQSDMMRQYLEKGKLVSIMSEMAKAARIGAVNVTKAGLVACKDADLILGGMGGVFPGIALAEKFQLPFIQAYLVPLTPTASFASVLLPAQLPLPIGSLRRASHHLTRQFLWQTYRTADRIARSEVLDLPNAPFLGPYNSEPVFDTPILYGFSLHVISPPLDWPDRTHITGYWTLEPPIDWSPPDGLEEFIESGTKPVCIGFGSMGNRDPKKITELVLKALEISGERAVLLSGWSGLDEAILPNFVFMIESVPHSWLYPRVAAVVHHGGVGTTAAGLRAGVPSVVIPYFGDQPFWGNRVAELGAGPRPIPRRKLTAKKLAHAIHLAISNKAMKERASELGIALRSENGIANAVSVIETYWKQRAS